jgi:hypothetical protein
MHIAGVGVRSAIFLLYSHFHSPPACGSSHDEHNMFTRFHACQELNLPTSSEGSGEEAIIGGVVGAAVLVIAGLVLLLIMRRRQRRAAHAQLAQAAKGNAAVRFYLPPPYSDVHHIPLLKFAFPCCGKYKLSHKPGLHNPLCVIHQYCGLLHVVLASPRRSGVGAILQTWRRHHPFVARGSVGCRTLLQRNRLQLLYNQTHPHCLVRSQALLLVLETSPSLPMHSQMSCWACPHLQQQQMPPHRLPGSHQHCAYPSQTPPPATRPPTSPPLPPSNSTL